MNDIFDMGSALQDGNLVDLLRDACEEAVLLDEAIEQQEEALKALKQRLHSLRSVKIPEAMAEAGVGDIFSLASGHIIKLGQFVSGSLPKEEDKRKVAMLVLEQHGGGALIKTEIGLTFGKGDVDEANKLAERLRANGYEPQVKQDVNAMSLQAFAREKLREGEELPLETLGLFAGTVAKITAPKEKK